MSHLWTHMQDPTSGLGMGTVATHRTRSTHLGRKDNLHALSGLAQPGTCLSLRTRRLPGGPIDLEMCLIKAFVGFSLPTVVRQNWTHQLDPLLVTADEQVSIDVPRIDDVFLRFEASLD